MPARKIIKTHEFIVQVRLKQGNAIQKQALRQYIQEAVRSWKGCYPPDSDEFMLNANQFFVRNMTHTIEREK